MQSGSWDAKFKQHWRIFRLFLLTGVTYFAEKEGMQQHCQEKHSF